MTIRVMHKGYWFSVYRLAEGRYVVNVTGGIYSSFGDAFAAARRHWQQVKTD